MQQQTIRVKWAIKCRIFIRLQKNATNEVEKTAKISNIESHGNSQHVYVLDSEWWIMLENTRIVITRFFTQSFAKMFSRLRHSMYEPHSGYFLPELKLTERLRFRKKKKRVIRVRWYRIEQDSETIWKISFGTVQYRQWARSHTNLYIVVQSLRHSC